MTRSTAASTDPNHIDPNFGTSYGDDFQLENIVDAVISFANDEVRPPQRLGPVFKAEDGTDLFLTAWKGELVKAPKAIAVKEFEERTDKARAYACEVLAIATQGTASLSKFVRSFGNDVMKAVDLALYPTLKFSADGRPKLGWRISGPSILEEWIRFAAVMAAAGARGEATGVARCQLQSCQRFFRVIRTGPGKPSTKYCPGTDHMAQAHQANSTLRSQKKRRADRRRAARPK
jgi:hypothetical protein